MALNTLNTGAISFKKLSGKVHTQQNFAVTEEGISTNVQMSYSTVFAEPIVALPVTTSGMSGLYNTNGIVERVQFEIDIIPDTQIAVGRSQGYRLKLPADYNVNGYLFPTFSAGTYLHTALGKLQIVPPLYGTLKPDGSTEYDPILRDTVGNVIAKFDPINWYFDSYSGIIFVQDPPVGYDSSAARPGTLEAFLYVGDYLDNLVFTGGTGSSNVTANNGLTKVDDTIGLGGDLTGNTTIGLPGYYLQLSGGSGSGLYTYFGTNPNTQGVLTVQENNVQALVGNSGTDDSIFEINDLGISLTKVSGFSPTYLSVQKGLIFIDSDVPTFKGMEYADDFSANFTNRSIPDVEWVLSQIGGTGNTGSTFAANGLTKVGNTIVLGGDLTGDTSIVGGSYDLNLGLSTGRFQITGSTWNFSWDAQNKRFIAGDNCQSTGGSINYTFGDSNVNAGTFGSAVFGELSTIENNVGAALAVGESVWVRGYGGKAFGRGSRVNSNAGFGFVGGVWTPGATDPKTNNKVPQVGGLGSFGFYSTDGSQTDNHGALASYSAILGGLNHNIPSNSTSSVVIGGDEIKVDSGVTNTVHLPKVRIGLGANASLVTDNANPNLLVFNSSTGEIEIRQAATITGGTGASSQNIYSLKRIVTGSTTLSGNDFVLFCNAVAPITIDTPASPVDGQVYKIKDVSGNAGTNTITINGNGKNIDGSSSIQINSNRGGIEMVYDQILDFWSVMNFVG